MKQKVLQMKSWNDKDDQQKRLYSDSLLNDLITQTMDAYPITIITDFDNN